jgi:hypothetical protein
VHRLSVSTGVRITKIGTWDIGNLEDGTHDPLGLAFPITQPLARGFSCPEG